MRPPITGIKLNELLSLLDENYYSIGVRSGCEALAEVTDDFISGRLNGNLADWGISALEFKGVVFFALARKWFSEGKMYQSHEEWCNWQKTLR